MFYCKDAFEGLAKMDQLIDADGRSAAGRRRPRRRPAAARPARRARRRRAAGHRRLGPQRRRGRRAGPDATVLGRARARGPDGRDLPPPRHPRAVQAALGRARRQGRGLAELVRDDFKPRLERMWREQTYLHPRALLGYFPCNADGNELIVWDPALARRERELERLVFPRQPRHDRICLADFYRPLGLRRRRRRRAAGGHRRRRGDRADGVARGRRRVRRAAVRPRARRADRRGHGRVDARPGP